MKGNWLPALITGLFFLAVGIVCLFWPRRIQQYALDYYERRQGMAVFDLFHGWVESEGYVLSLRFIGVAGIAAFILIVLVLITESLS